EGDVNRFCLVIGTASYPPRAEETGSRDYGVDPIERRPAVAAAIDQVDRPVTKGDLIESDVFEEISGHHSRRRRDAPRALTGCQPFERKDGLYKIDGLDPDLAIKEACQRHSDFYQLGCKQIRLGGIHRIGDPDFFDRESWPGKQPDRDGPLDRHIAPSQALAELLDIGAVEIPIDN